MVETCPKCGRTIHEEDAAFCPYCAKPLRQKVIGRTDFPTAGGVLLIIAVSVCVLAGVVATLIFAATSNYSYYGSSYSPRYEDLLAGGGGILAFVYGLAAGIFSLKRKMFTNCLTGGVVTLAEGFLLVLAFAQQWSNSWIIGVMFGVPIILLSSTGLFFISLSKNEYR
jgi:hypothetical protein